MAGDGKRCKWCGEPGVFVIQPVMFLGQPIMHEGIMCQPCQVRLAGANRFLVTTTDDGKSLIAMLDEDNQPLMPAVTSEPVQ
jgi:hypothetical protein